MTLHAFAIEYDGITYVESRVPCKRRSDRQVPQITDLAESVASGNSLRIRQTVPDAGGDPETARDRLLVGGHVWMEFAGPPKRKEKKIASQGV